MHRYALAILMAVSLPLFAQAPPRRVLRPGPTPFADNAEMAIKQAAEQLTAIKKITDRDLAVLDHIRVADGALTDPMQPFNAIQKAYEEVDAAKTLLEAARSQPAEFAVYQGVIKTERELESAKLSPMTADFGHLRLVVGGEALGPARRAALRDAIRVQDELLAWLRVQQLISDHVKALSEISSQTLRASEQ